MLHNGQTKLRAIIGGNCVTRFNMLVASLQIARSFVVSGRLQTKGSTSRISRA